MKNALDTQKATKKESCRYERKKTANEVAFTDMGMSRPMKRREGNEKVLARACEVEKDARRAQETFTELVKD